MVSVTEQYEAFPYPERDPADEAKRLILGSPSHPLEIDHHVFGGKREWSRPLRALVAGGGTGDGLIQMAQVLAHARAPYEIVYLDLSKTAREIAEARATARGLTGIRFETGSLLDAGQYGPFDYIDCCGVLHHLPEPSQGFAALRAALAPEGGLGFMVYAPYGRTGVYPLQEAFGQLYSDLAPEERVSRAKALLKALPPGHPFLCNPNLKDHHASDAGFYDLLLHGQDRAYSVSELLGLLDKTGWRLQSFCTPALYDLAQLTERPKGLSDPDAMQIAEKLLGTLRLHVGYARPKDAPKRQASGSDRSLVPHLRGVKAAPLAKAVAAGKALPLSLPERKATLRLPREAAPLIAAIDGQRSLAEIAHVSRLDPLVFGTTWAPVEKSLVAWGLMLFSNLGRR